MANTTTFSSSVLKSKFRGCMIGVLVGDCLGIPFEFRDCEFKDGAVKYVPPSKEKLNDFMIDSMSEESTKMFYYTDDTMMTINVASSLVDKKEINTKDMAEKFVADFFNQKRSRGYGTHVRRVFIKLRDSKYADVFLPAKEQFNGSGSFGNGAAMRIAPIALFGSNKGEEYIMKAAKECALITHAHSNGYRGAILQCLAVNAALGLDPSLKFDAISFISNLLEKMEEIETEREKPYCESLRKMKEFFIQKREDISSEEIAQCLGNGDDVSALKSVPTAIYSFLRGMKPLKIADEFTLKSVPACVNAYVYSYLTGKPSKTYLESSNPFMRTVFFAISVGGDSDTIASMAGAIAGAYYGEDMIPEVVKKKCEAIDDITSLADKLFDVTYSDK